MSVENVVFYKSLFTNYLGLQIYYLSFELISMYVITVLTKGPRVNYANFPSDHFSFLLHFHCEVSTELLLEQ
jgi:hypothetical protein